VEQNSVDWPAVEESRTLRIEADAIRTHLAFAVFALLDAHADAMLAIEQSREPRPRIGLCHQDAAH
jgi:hypothetical protein